jgi:hypothetical protein
VVLSAIEDIFFISRTDFDVEPIKTIKNMLDKDYHSW